MATRSELATLVGLSSAFTNRIAICIVFYAQYILGNNTSTISRLSWAKQAIFNPFGVASQIAPVVSVDPIFSNLQSPVSDWTVVLNALPETGAGSLQAAVENALNTTVLQF